DAVEFDSAHTLACSLQGMPAWSQPPLVRGWLKISAHTLTLSYQRMIALSQSNLVSGWLQVWAIKVEDWFDAVEAGFVHTLACSLQRMPAWSQSALVRGWMEVSAASTVEASAKTSPNATIETIAFIAPPMKCLEAASVTWSCLQAI